MAKNGELTTRQRRMITTLLTSRNIGEACQAAGVGRTTLDRWLDEEPLFSQELRRAEAQAIDDASRQLIGLADGAVKTVEAIMHDDATPVAVRLRAAQIVFDDLINLRKLASLEERVMKLEMMQYVKP